MPDEKNQSSGPEAAPQKTEQWMTEEQMHDVYMEGTSDGNVRVEKGTIHIENRKDKGD
jgi:hypothetical protein